MFKSFGRLVVVLTAVAGIGITTVDAVDSPDPERIRPMANCVGTNIYVVYNKPVGCNVTPPQRLHEVYIPSTWTLAQAHNYCVSVGSTEARTRFGGYANVCPDVDY